MRELQIEQPESSSELRFAMATRAMATFGFVVLPIVLLIAAWTKSATPTFGLALTGDVIAAKFLTGMVVVVEASLAILLVLRCWPKATSGTAMVLFALFAIIAFSQVVSGQASCGCFGNYGISPIWMLVFDLFAVVSLVVCFQAGVGGIGGFQAPPWVALVGCVVVATAGVFNIASVSVSELDDQNKVSIESLDGIVVLTPEKWIGQRLLIRDFLVGPEPDCLSAGQCTLVLYSHDCEDCQRLIDTLAGDDSTQSLVLMELPPYSPGQPPDTDRISWCRLSDSYRWIVRTPAVLLLRDGYVESVGGGEFFQHDAIID